jgi:predicted amidohydrolase YtcJ
LDLGIHQAFSSDSPVESANPLLTLAAALDHPQPEKSLSLQEALAASTENVAYVLGEEESRGELRVGATADLSVVQADSFDDLTAEKLRRTEIALTIRAGRIIHRAQDF